MKASATELANLEQEVAPVTFYAWVDAGDRYLPSSTAIKIAGGEFHRDASGCQVALVDYHEVRFLKGVYQTSNPVEIREIRKLMKHDTITEDKEVYLAMIEDPKRRAERLARKSGELNETIKSNTTEVMRLRALLNAK